MEQKFIKCEYCNGEGWRLEYSYHSTPTSNDLKHCCMNCNGQGKLVIIPNGFNSIRESEIR